MPPAKSGGKQKLKNVTEMQSPKCCPPKYYCSCRAGMSKRDERKIVSRNATVLVRPRCLAVNLGALLITTIYPLLRSAYTAKYSCIGEGGLILGSFLIS